MILSGGPPWGVRITADDNDNIIVSTVAGRAEQAGVRKNDRLLAVNGQSTKNLDVNEIQRLIMKTRGTLQLDIDRDEFDRASFDVPKQDVNQSNLGANGPFSYSDTSNKSPKMQWAPVRFDTSMPPLTAIKTTAQDHNNSAFQTFDAATTPYRYHLAKSNPNLNAPNIVVDQDSGTVKQAAAHFEQVAKNSAAPSIRSNRPASIAICQDEYDSSRSQSNISRDSGSVTPTAAAHHHDTTPHRDRMDQSFSQLSTIQSVTEPSSERDFNHNDCAKTSTPMPFTQSMSSSFTSNHMSQSFNLSDKTNVSSTEMLSDVGNKGVWTPGQSASNTGIHQPVNFAMGNGSAKIPAAPAVPTGAIALGPPEKLNNPLKQSNPNPTNDAPFSLPDGSYRQIPMQRPDDTPAIKSGPDWYEKALDENRSTIEYPTKQGVREMHTTNYKLRTQIESRLNGSAPIKTPRFTADEQAASVTPKPLAKNFNSNSAPFARSSSPPMSVRSKTPIPVPSPKVPFSTPHSKSTQNLANDFDYSTLSGRRSRLAQDVIEPLEQALDRAASARGRSVGSPTRPKTPSLFGPPLVYTNRYEYGAVDNYEQPRRFDATLERRKQSQTNDHEPTMKQEFEYSSQTLPRNTKLKDELSTLMQNKTYNYDTKISTFKTEQSSKVVENDSLEARKALVQDELRSTLLNDAKKLQQCADAVAKMDSNLSLDQVGRVVNNPRRLENMTPAPALPPPPVNYQKDIDFGDYYKPYRETKTTKRTINQKNFKYEGIGPVDASGTPMSLRQHVDPSLHSDWYREMYNRMHRIDDRETSVGRERSYSQHLNVDTGIGSGQGSQLSPKQNYQAYGPYNSYEFKRVFERTQNAPAKPRWPSNTDSLDRRPTSMRARSTPRYELYNPDDHSPGFAGPRIYKSEKVARYQHQPSPLHDYKPGESSLARAEQERIRQNSLPPRSGLSDYSASRNEEQYQRCYETWRESSPYSTLSRHSYRQVQNGADIPYSGMRRPAPENTDGILDNTEIDRIFNEEREKMKANERRRNVYTPSAGGFESRNERLLSVSPFRTQSALSIGTNNLHLPSVVPSRGHSPSMMQGDSNILRGVAKALYTFIAHNERELSFRKGDLIRILRQIDQNWYEGELNRRQGIVPVNYVEMAAVAKPDSGLTYTEVEENTEGRAQVLYDFEPRVAIELHLKRGDYVTLRRRIDDNWYEGWAPSGKGGIFPANYIKVLEEPLARNKRISNDCNSPADSGVSSQYQTAGAYGAIRGQSQRQPVIAPKTFYQSTAPTSRPTSSLLARAPSPKAFDRQLDVKSHELKQIARSLEGQGHKPPPDAQLYRALYPYTPQNADELELGEGDEIYVMEKCDDGWYIGTSTRTGQFGTFPGNYAQSC